MIELVQQYTNEELEVAIALSSYGTAPTGVRGLMKKLRPFLRGVLIVGGILEMVLVLLLFAAGRAGSNAMVQLLLGIAAVVLGVISGTEQQKAVRILRTNIQRMGSQVIYVEDGLLRGQAVHPLSKLKKLNLCGDVAVAEWEHLSRPMLLKIPADRQEAFFAAVREIRPGCAITRLERKQLG